MNPKKQSLDAIPEIASIRLPTFGRNTPHLIPFLQGPATNMLSTVSTSTKAAQKAVSVDPITSEGQLTLTLGRSSMIVHLTNYTSLEGVKVSTNKLLDAIIMRFTGQNSYRAPIEQLQTEITFPLREYLTMLGREVTDNQLDILRRSVKKDLETLGNLSIEWTENDARSNHSSTDFMRIRLFSKYGIIRGNIIVSLTPELANYLSNAYIMQYDTRLLTTNERHPSAYHIGRKFIQTLNYIKKQNPKSTSGIISVLKLIEACPDIPSVENVTRRHYERDIIVPFEAALNSLLDSGFCHWEYVNSKNMPLTDEQLKNLDYQTILSAYIHFEILQPD